MKETTHNDYHHSVNKAVDYINRHLQEPMDLKTIAGVSCLSEFHFHRIFKAYIGEPVGAYILRLRLERTAQHLQKSDDTLTEIAEKTGYQSPQALSKAFKRHFGINPSAFKNMQTYFASTFSKPTHKNLNLQPVIKAVDEKQLVYIRIIAKYGSEIAYKTAWEKLWRYAQQQQLINQHSEFIGLSFDDPNITKHEQCRFYACISTDKPIKPQGAFGTLSVDQGTFAVFTLKGAYKQLNDCYRYIYFDWLPNSGYNLRNAMCFEKYLNNPDTVPKSNLLTEIYIPIQNP